MGSVNSRWGVPFHRYSRLGSRAHVSGQEGVTPPAPRLSAGMRGKVGAQRQGHQIAKHERTARRPQPAPRGGRRARAQPTRARPQTTSHREHTGYGFNGER
eukprot:4548060-Prymnesium_polylepis.1